MGQNRRKQFDPEFKRNAVLLSKEPGRKVSEIANNLGIKDALLYRWRREESGERGKAFPGNGNLGLSEVERENMTLKKQLAEARMERDILKKAVAFFSKESK